MNRQWIDRLCEATGLPATALVDYLQERGLVSDNCVTLEETADIDAGKAYIKVLHEK